jgi:hypothetical protein
VVRETTNAATPFAAPREMRNYCELFVPGPEMRFRPAMSTSFQHRVIAIRRDNEIDTSAAPLRVSRRQANPGADPNRIRKNRRRFAIQSRQRWFEAAQDERSGDDVSELSPRRCRGDTNSSFANFSSCAAVFFAQYA